jgi:hypothetical protein
VFRSVRAVGLPAFLLIFALGIGQVVGPGARLAWRLFLALVTDEVADPSTDGFDLQESDDAIADRRTRSAHDLRAPTGRASVTAPRSSQDPALLDGVTRSPPLT